MMTIQLTKLPTIACGIPNTQKHPQKYSENTSKSCKLTGSLANATVAYKRCCSFQGTSLQLQHPLYHYYDFFKNLGKISHYLRSTIMSTELTK